MIAITVCYKSGRHLDFNYYQGTHVPLVLNNLKPLGMKNAEIRNVLASADGTTPPYQLITSLYFPDAETFERATNQAGWKDVVADIAHFYPEAPDVLVTEIWE